MYMRRQVLPSHRIALCGLLTDHACTSERCDLEILSASGSWRQRVDADVSDFGFLRYILVATHIGSDTRHGVTLRRTVM